MGDLWYNKCKENYVLGEKSLHFFVREVVMYRHKNGQIGLMDFQQPAGMQLKEDNRWVKKAQLVPWDKIEKRYAKLFPGKTGNVAKPLQLALGACLIQQEYGFSDVEVAMQIQENPYLQYFCGYPGYDDSKLPFDPSLMVHFRKRLSPEIIAEATKDDDDQDDDSKSTPNNNSENTSGNSGTLIVDATCAPQNIKYPQDIELLNEAREKTEQFIDKICKASKTKKPGTYRKRARKDYLQFAKSKKRTNKKIRNALKKQLLYLHRNFGYIDELLQRTGYSLSEKDTKQLEFLKKLYEQQSYMYENRTHSVPDRIVSISQPFVRPIVRGKVKEDVEFGMKLDISVSDGWTRLEYYSFDPYNEALNLPETIEAYYKREGHYPKRVLADKIYRNRENIRYCKERGIRLSGAALGRPKKNEVRDKRQDHIDECERIEVECKFSLAKLKFGMGLVKAKLENTIEHVISMSILLLNLTKILCAFFDFLLTCLLQTNAYRKIVVVQ